MKKPSCNDCPFYASALEVNEPHGMGQCRRNPPMLILSQNGGGSTTWPPVKSVWWCGEHPVLKATPTRATAPLEIT